MTFGQRMYIGGAIFGLMPEEIAANFVRGAMVARSLGFTAVRADLIDPNQHPGSACPPGRMGQDDKHNEGCHLRADLKELLNCDAALFTAGWTRSWGSKLEVQVATASGIAVYAEMSGGLFAWLT